MGDGPGDGGRAAETAHNFQGAWRRKGKEGSEGVIPKDPPKVECRVLTVHLEPVLPARRSSHLKRLDMAQVTQDFARERALERTKTQEFED